MKVFYDPVQKSHILSHEIIAGKKFRHHERAARSDMILRHLKLHGGFEFHVPKTLPIDLVLSVHQAEYIEFLASSKSLPKESVIWPYVFPSDLRLPRRLPANENNAGYYCFDVGTPIMSDTWQASLASASGAYAAAEYLRSTSKTCFALARPPGHHAGGDFYGGYCYLNNAAIAAQYLSQFGNVLLIDFDFHHGNGTQSIFYDSNTVCYYSIHCDPVHEYPYYSGYADEVGEGKGKGFNFNVPLAPGTRSEDFLSNFKNGLQKSFHAIQPSYVVVSAGFDGADDDPLGHFGLLPADFHTIGVQLRSLNVPLCLVQEGGYHVPNLGINVLAFLSSFF